MTSWKRITLVAFLLIGGTISFGYWSTNQFNQAFDNLNAPYAANVLTVSSSLNEDTDFGLSFTFPQKDNEVYIGCTYPISWQSSTIVDSLEIALIDAGSKKIVETAVSGLAKENIIEKNLQNLNWKIRTIWPGEYFIKISKINGIEAEFKSKVFKINKMPEGLGEKEKSGICRKFSD